MACIAMIYLLIFRIIRNVEKKVIRNYYNYKYGFVRILEESLRGADMFKVYDVK